MAGKQALISSFLNQRLFHKYQLIPTLPVLSHNFKIIARGRDIKTHLHLKAFKTLSNFLSGAISSCILSLVKGLVNSNL